MHCEKFVSSAGTLLEYESEIAKDGHSASRAQTFAPSATPPAARMAPPRAEKRGPGPFALARRPPGVYPPPFVAHRPLVVPAAATHLRLDPAQSMSVCCPATHAVSTSPLQTFTSRS